MKDFNQVILEGHLAKDPTMDVSGKSPVTFLVVATNRVWTTQEGDKVVKHEAVEYHNVSCFGRLAELNVQFTKKGAHVRVIGRLHYENQELPVMYAGKKLVGADGKPLTYWTCKVYINAQVIDWLDNLEEKTEDPATVSDLATAGITLSEN